MKFFWVAALCAALLSSCAGTQESMLLDCSEESSIAHGSKDGAKGRTADFSFLQSCSEGTREAAEAAYREAFEGARLKRLSTREPGPEKLGSESIPNVLRLPEREPAAVDWVCEVEASSKIFTGVGVTRDEALKSARSTCGSHFHASYCERADCKQSL